MRLRRVEPDGPARRNKSFAHCEKQGSSEQAYRGRLGNGDIQPRGRHFIEHTPLGKIEVIAAKRELMGQPKAVQIMEAIHRLGSETQTALPCRDYNFRVVGSSLTFKGLSWKDVSC